MAIDPMTNSVAYQRPSRRPKAREKSGRASVSVSGLDIVPTTKDTKDTKEKIARNLTSLSFVSFVSFVFCLSSRAQHVPDAPDGVKQLLLERSINLVAQPAYQHIDDVRLRIEVVRPHV